MGNKDELLDVSEHIRELRNRLIVCVIAFIIAFIAFYAISSDVITFITNDGKNMGYEFVFISPAEILVQKLRVSAILALLIIIPVIVYEVAMFIKPSIESPMIGLFVTFMAATIMFAAGVAFSYFVILPFIFNTFYDIGVESGIMAQISIEKFIDLYISLNAALGVIFELPLVVYVLSKLSILTPELMKKGQGAMIFVSTVIGMVLTPPDVFSQIIVAIPIIILYEISILICKKVYKGKK